MKYPILPAALLCAFLGLGGATAEERIDHFNGLPAETLEDAVQNFSEYNNRLAAIVAKDELTASDLATVHELTYTLENALEKINDELAALADLLEEVHVASETADAASTVEKGRAYLDTARTVIP
ncbi:hypothetical protein TVNIR_0592 [Thioalkalivibrio nitratireducens DSM 14787]|uniref:Uncharacterized protein n=1 Tax=Thioalkalivibrio nitratireducens (strain DSM 14787 / UNIQEM 213 / ALEN2) TaxID=1255043 RepID=L0DTG7_THIND|nr:DUF6746 family protein [Thioalkalivibrio nitratireducens]AGA32292.1 hypothetical protein TVNIR_0592 [Thioalkalivibrio nitratireducens DSM 14787]